MSMLAVAICVLASAAMILMPLAELKIVFCWIVTLVVRDHVALPL